MNSHFFLPIEPNRPKTIEIFLLVPLEMSHAWNSCPKYSLTFSAQIHLVPHVSTYLQLLVNYNLPWSTPSQQDHNNQYFVHVSSPILPLSSYCVISIFSMPQLLCHPYVVLFLTALALYCSPPYPLRTPRSYYVVLLCQFFFF